MRFLDWKGLTPWEIWFFIAGRVLMSFALGTGEPAFAALRKALGDHYLYAGLGSFIELP